MTEADGSNSVTVKREPKEGDIVKVDWHDIREFGWNDYTEYPPGDLPLEPAVSYGEFLYMDHEKLVIARETIGAGVDRQIFPIGCVVEITILEPVNEPVDIPSAIAVKRPTIIWHEQDGHVEWG